MRILILAVLAASLCGCGLIYKLPTRQGNVIEQKEIDKLEIGMTREQVRFVMGTPMAANSLQPNRWDYFGYYKSPRGKTFSRTVSLYFEGEKLARMVGNEAPATETELTSAPTDEKVAADAEKDAQKRDAGSVVETE